MSWTKTSSTSSGSGSGPAINDTTPSSTTVFSGQKTQNLADSKAATTHNHAQSDITGLSTSLSGKANVGDSFTKAEANTNFAVKSSEHSHTNKTVLDKITQSGAETSIDVSSIGKTGTKLVDETSIANGKILQYNGTSGKVEYVTPAGGGSTITKGTKTGSVSAGAGNGTNFSLAVTGYTSRNQIMYRVEGGSDGLPATYKRDLSSDANFKIYCVLSSGNFTIYVENLSASAVTVELSYWLTT